MGSEAGSMNIFRPLKPGEYVYLRCRVLDRKLEGPPTGQLAEEVFGEYQLEPISRTGVGVMPGKFVYAFREEMITTEEAKRMVRA